MTRTRWLLAALLAAACAAPAPAELKKGSIDLKTPGPLAFGPKNVLFISDLATATIYAVDTRDEKVADPSAAVGVEKVDVKIAEMVGTRAPDIAINDVKVNPATGNVFLSVAKKTTGTGLIAVVDRGGKITELVLKDIPCDTLKLADAPAGQRRNQAVTALAFAADRLFISGLSNEEFASTLRTVAFPFVSADKGTGVEIYHGAHGKWETASPIRTFTPVDISGQAHLLAAYTCTPLVKFSLTDLKPGEKVKGVTVAELGNRNTPLDMVPYQKGGKGYLLIANTARGVMKVNLEGVEQTEAITSKISGTAGLKYDTINDLKGVMQLDRLSDTQALALIKSGDNFDLRSLELP